VAGPSSTAIRSGFPILRAEMHPLAMGTKSRETIYGASVRVAAERAEHARKEADKLACEAWNKRMLGLKGPAQPSPTLGDALNAGYGFVEDFLIPIKASFVSLISFPTHPLELGWEIPVLRPLESPGGASRGCFSPAWPAGQVMASAPSRKSVAMAVELTRRSNPAISTTAHYRRSRGTAQSPSV
jgi:hypothetical protein